MQYSNISSNSSDVSDETMNQARHIWANISCNQFTDKDLVYL